MQTILDFKKAPEHKENNDASQRHYEENKKRFSNQCKIVYEALKRGERLSTYTAMVKYQIADLRRRIKDLKDYHHINIKDEMIRNPNGRGRYKVWFVE